MAIHRALACAATLFALMAAPAAFAQDVEGTQLGVHNAPGCSSKELIGVKNVEKFAAWLGRRPDRILDFAWRQSWSEVQRSTDLLTKCWYAAGYKTITFSLPLLPDDNVSTFQDGDKGAYDDNFRKLAETIVANGYPDATIRLAWEFNIPGSGWSAYKDPKGFVKLWRRAVKVMRSVPGARFTFDWCPTLDMALRGQGRVAPDLVYPGDAYVDYVGLDVYNGWWGDPAATFEQRWNTWLTYKYGLNWLHDFAAAHGKRISIPEWGTGTRPDGHGGGDDPDFVHHMAAWFRQNNVAYQDYWDEHAKDYDANLSDGGQPKAAAAYKEEFAR